MLTDEPGRVLNNVVGGAGVEQVATVAARFGLRLTLVGFGLAAASGTTMFLTQPDELLANLPFRIKLALLLCAGLNAAAFHWRGGVARDDGVGRAQTLASLGLWLAIIICGRSIAYY